MNLRTSLLLAGAISLGPICHITLVHADMPPRQSSAPRLEYALKAQALAPDTYAVLGRNEHFTMANGGNIVNTAFIITSAGVVVIDSGPSRRYGEALLTLIRRYTDAPIVRVWNTHHHPDHVLGNQAFPLNALAALPGTRSALARDGEGFNDNLYRLTGEWMAGTQVVVPPHAVTPGRSRVGDHDFELIAMQGHTSDDLVIYDHRTGVLFAGDLLFHERAPTTPHADIPAWLDSLQRLTELKPRVVLPGHGAPTTDLSPIHQTRDYLSWLQAHLQQAAREGLDMGEVMALPLPARIQALAVSREEYRRSVTHLYPAIEQAVLTQQ